MKEFNWENTKLGWYKTSVIMNYRQVPEVEKWLEEHIEGYKKHTIYRFVWAKRQYQGDVNLDIKFRKEKDYLLFVLTWQ